MTPLSTTSINTRVNWVMRRRANRREEQNISKQVVKQMVLVV